jgi:predicted permease
MLMPLVQDLRYSLRSLAARPGFTSIVVLTLALGIGANVGIFSAFHQLLLRPLPVLEPDRLVLLSAPGPKQGSTSTGIEGRDPEVFSWSMWRDLAMSDEARTVFQGIAAHRSFGAGLSLDSAVRGGGGVMVSGDYFGVLGLKPALGRLITPEDTAIADEGRVVVLGHGYWQNDLGGDREVIGKLLSVNGERLQIVGVAPPEFTGTARSSAPLVYVPITLAKLAEPGRDPGFENRSNYWIYLIARLADGINPEQAQAAINAPFQRLVREVEMPLQSGVSEDWLRRFAERQIELLPGSRGQSNLIEGARAPLTLLLAVTALVLLVACVNVANLLLARGASRRGEIAVRSAMGAGTGRIAVGVLVEAFILALAGALVGVLLAIVTLKSLIAVLPPDQVGLLSAQLDGSAIGYAAAIACITALIFGIVPVWQAWQAQPIEAIRAQAGRGNTHVGAARLRTGLATAQVTLSMALLVVAGLLIQSLANVARIDLGMQVERVATFRVAPDRSGYTGDRMNALYAGLEERLQALPDVAAVGASVVPLLSDSNWRTSLAVEGFDAGPDTDTNASFNIVGQGLVNALGIPLLRGREFTAADDADRPMVAIVNQAFARKFEMGEDVVGKRMAMGGSGDELNIEIVGLIADAKYSQVKDEIPPQFLIPWRQHGGGIGSMSFYVRAAGNVDPLLSAFANVVAELDPNLPVSQVAELPAVVSENVFTDRLIGTLASAFAALATLLAAVGLYGVLSFALAQRTRELGLRLALGAAPARLRRLVYADVAWTGAVGCVLGLIAAVVLGRLAQSLLFGVSGFEWLPTLAAVGVLGVVLTLAGWLPARRAARTDPMVALRYE